jgi:hypothetical protein
MGITGRLMNEDERQAKIKYVYALVELTSGMLKVSMTVSAMARVEHIKSDLCIYV